jgi:hypothetical protein
LLVFFLLKSPLLISFYFSSSSPSHLLLVFFLLKPPLLISFYFSSSSPSPYSPFFLYLLLSFCFSPP